MSVEPQVQWWASEEKTLKVWMEESSLESSQLFHEYVVICEHIHERERGAV